MTHRLVVLCIAVGLQIQICVNLSDLGSKGLRKSYLLLFGFLSKRFVFPCQPSVAISHFILFMFKVSACHLKLSDSISLLPGHYFQLHNLCHLS
jgi:hypothetical protein